MTERLPLRARLARSWLSFATLGAVLLGCVLGVSVHKGWLALAGLGFFGPGLLRELGLLADRDEYQLLKARTAGHHAYLASGILLLALLIVRGWSTLNFDAAGPAGINLFVWMLLVYFLSYVFQYWGPRRAATRILITFGSFWLVFVLLSHGAEGGMALLMELLVPLPFFVLALAARRWPRVSGALLVALALFAFQRFGLARVFQGEEHRLFALLLVFLPILASGLGLLFSREARDEA